MKYFRRILLALMIALMIVMAAATVIEKYHGTSYVHSYIYRSVWFATLWIVAGGVLFFTMIKEKSYRHLPTLFSHSAIVLIIIGMIFTTFTSQSGRLILNKDKAVHYFTNKDSTQNTLPFSVELSDFQVYYYPGTFTPQDYVSHIIFKNGDGESIPAQISMNHIARYKGYRFYQSGYHPDGDIILTVTHDPWGIGLTYAGYLLLTLSLLFLICDKNENFRKLLRNTSMRSLLLLIFFTFSSITLSAQITEKKTTIPRTLPKESAAKMGKINVLYNHRICPLQTLARDFTTKLYGTSTYKGLTSEQVFSGWIFYFTDWCQEPIFKIKGKKVQSTLEINSQYASFIDYTNDIGQYRLSTVLDTMDFHNPDRRNFLAAEEKYNLILMLYNGDLLKIFPVSDSTGNLLWCSQSDPLPLSIPPQEYAFIRYFLSYSQELVLQHDYATLDTLWEKTVIYQERNAKGALPSKFRSRMERLYNTLLIGRTSAMLCICIGIFFFTYALICFGRQRTSPRWMKITEKIWLLSCTFYLFILFCLRWIVSGHIPMGNGYETMLFMALCTAGIGLVFGHKHPLLIPAGILLTGLALLVAMMGGANPTITHLMPVLSSPLLCLHVTVIMAAYTLLAFIMLNGMAAIGLFAHARLTHKQYNHSLLQQLQITSQLMLYPALFLLSIGIIIGAIWANITWGTYWSWDPKEVWALITLMMYLLPLHSNHITQFQKPLFFHIYTILAFLSVLFTYFGVNFLLGGMHSYA